ncbi:MAG: ADP-ribosylglycohydrolase family protein [Gammaproteobacteria bacterium]
MCPAPALDRIAGALIGQCIGDAAGFVVEGAGTARCAAYAGRFRAAPSLARVRARFAPGQYSDDSQLARELMDSIASRGGFVPQDYARRIAALFGSGRIVGGGRVTGEAAARIAAGVHWSQAGGPAPDAGNGAAMRAAPIGLLYHDDPAALAAAAHDQGRITHADPRSGAGAIAIAAAAAMASTGESIDAAAICARLAGATRGLDPVLGTALDRLPEWLVLAPDAAAALIAELGVKPAYAARWTGISGFVTPSVTWSLYAFLRTPEDFVATVATAIGAGGDTDTTAAMAGALSGAYLGLRSLPVDLAAAVHDRGTWGRAALVDLARRFHAVVAARTTP